MASAVQFPGWGRGRESRSGFLEVFQVENEQPDSPATPQPSQAWNLVVGFSERVILPVDRSMVERNSILSCYMRKGSSQQDLRIHCKALSHHGSLRSGNNHRSGSLNFVCPEMRPWGAIRPDAEKPNSINSTERDLSSMAKKDSYQVRITLKFNSFSSVII